MSVHNKAVKLEQALEKLKQEKNDLSKETVREVVYASSKIFNQGSSLQYEAVDNIIKKLFSK
jgi:hypothetical protein